MQQRVNRDAPPLSGRLPDAGNLLQGENMLDVCERCGSGLPYWQEHTGSICFYGGVVVKVCTACHTEADSLLRNDPLWLDLNTVQTEGEYLLAAAQGGQDTRAELLALVPRRRDLEQRAHELVSAWLGERKKAPQRASTY